MCVTVRAIVRIEEHEDGEEWTREAVSHSTVCEIEGWSMFTSKKTMCVEKEHEIKATGIENKRKATRKKSGKDYYVSHKKEYGGRGEGGANVVEESNNNKDRECAH